MNDLRKKITPQKKNLYYALDVFTDQLIKGLNLVQGQTFPLKYYNL